MPTKSFRFKHDNSSLYTGPSLNYYSDDDSDDSNDNNYDSDNDDYYAEVELKLPKKNYCTYILQDEIGSVAILLKKEFNIEANAKKFMLQTYSLVNDMTPFVVTGSTSSYKDTGSYGEPIEITYTKIKNFDTDKIGSSSYVHGVIIDSDGSVIDTLSITPPG